MQTYDCYILSYFKYGDHDAILHCFSAEAGAVTFFLKGIYSAKNKKKPYLFPLSRLRVTTSKVVSSHQISKVSKIELHPDHFDFKDVRSHSILFFVADFLNQVLREEGTNETIFYEIEYLCAELANHNFDAYLKFLIRYLMISGVAPLVQSADYLNPESGVFEKNIMHQKFDFSVSELWKNLLQKETAFTTKLNRKNKNAFLDSIIIYCQYHISGFNVPHSLSVVRQIFE